ncbi:hypothetical protein J2Z29_002174 [Treponema pedis]
MPWRKHKNRYPKKEKKYKAAGILESERKRALKKEDRGLQETQIMKPLFLM